MDDVIQRLHLLLGGRYTVERQVGEGGMAIVFLARDLKHQRPVAIKVLKPQVAASIGPDRFLQEIQIAAQLQHPHILPLYDSGSGDGLIYYVMPFVEGESLRERLAREGPLSIRDAVNIALEVGSALEYAHQQGVIHRDIKPANVLLSRGHAMVSDFGIARALRAAGPGMTQAGMIVGTPEYMSPEQALSGEHLDGRSDLYSLGCVLYEMLTGRPPFQGATLQAVIAQAVTSDFPSARATGAGIPRWLDRVIAKATAKNPEERFPSAAEFCEALEGPPDRLAAPRWRRWMVAAAVLVLVGLAVGWLFRGEQISGRVSVDAEVIAVLPFVAEGSGVELLGQGMADLMATNLDAVGGIRTIDPRTVLHRLPRRVRADLADRQQALAAGREIQASAVLFGSMVAASGAVRMTAELYGVDGHRIARAGAEGPVDSVFALVDTLSVRLIREVWRSRDPIPEFRVSAVTTGSLDAIRAYLKGEQHLRASQWDSAITAFESAVEADSTFALALLQLSIAYRWRGGHGDTSALRYGAAAARYADRLPLRERLLVASNELLNRGDLAAVDSLRGYAARYPNDAEGWFFLGEAQFHAQPLIGLTPSELFAPFDRVLELDPTLMPALIHPLELGLLFSDSTRFAEYLSRLEAGGSAEAAEPYRWLATVARGGMPLTVGDIVARIETDGLAILGTLVDLSLRRESVPVDTVVAALEAARHGLDPPPDLEETLWRQQLGLLLAVGRTRAARAALDSLWRSAPDIAARFAIEVAVAEYPGWGDAERAYERLAVGGDKPWRATLRAAYALTRGDVIHARRIVEMTDTLGASRFERALTRALDGWAVAAQGDTASGVRQMRRALEAAGFEPPASVQADLLRFQFAKILVRRRSTSDEGIHRLRYDWYLRASSPFVYPLQLLVLAKTQESAGDLNAAADTFRRLLEVWSGADPELAELRDAAREALRHLTGTVTS